jgi:hypothetical protein
MKSSIVNAIISLLFGALGAWGYVYFQGQPNSENRTVRATRFELTDHEGRVLATLDKDANGDTVLSFLTEQSSQRETKGRVASFGASRKGDPFIRFAGIDGRARLLMHLIQQDKPVLLMSDGAFEGRLLLGFVTADAPSPKDDDWALLFKGPSVAGIGSIKNPSSGRHQGFVFGALRSHQAEQRNTE